MSFTRFATSEPFTVASGERLNQFGDEIDNKIGVLNEQINVLNDDRGYLNTKALKDYDLNLLIVNGLYYINAPINTPVPSNSNNNGYCEVIYSNAQGYYTQMFTQTVTGTKWYRVCSGGIWVPWQQIATTTKTSFSCTAKTGYTIVSQNCYKLNGLNYFNVVVKKTDGTAFTTVEQHDVLETPLWLSSTALPVIGNNGVYNNGVCAGITANNIVAITVLTNGVIAVTIGGCA